MASLIRPCVAAGELGEETKAASYISENITDATFILDSTTRSIGPAMLIVLVTTRLLQRKEVSPLRRNMMFFLRRPHKRCVVI